jgi:oxygen-independent coproporphyrinogen-3 oxidase
MKNLGIYMQVPFCQTKCTYCNFHTGVVSFSRFAPYMEAVCREIQSHKELYRRAGVDLPEGFGVGGVGTVYIGGGTPSLLDPEHLQTLMKEIRGTFDCEPTEVTLEADPETVELEKAAAWLAAGINRVSLGVQSFVDKELVATGRMHRQADIYRAAQILREAGIANISFDLIAGLPHQTKESWNESLRELVKLSPEHVSVYLLEVDEESRLGKELLDGGARYGAGAVPGEDEMEESYEQAQRIFSEAGYHHYEISNWAKAGFESRHNLKYWRREPYLGFGAGAHSFSGKQRWANVHDAAEYVAAIEKSEADGGAFRIAGSATGIEQLETVSAAQELEEELFLGLRQLDGIDVSRIEREHGPEWGEKLRKLQVAGFVERNGDVVRLSEGKLSVSNEVFVELMK